VSQWKTRAAEGGLGLVMLHRRETKIQAAIVSDLSGDDSGKERSSGNLYNGPAREGGGKAAVSLSLVLVTTAGD